MAPNLCPARLTIAVERFAVSVRGRLVILLQIKNFGNPIMRKRTILADFERLVELTESAGQVSLLREALSTDDRGSQFDVLGVGQHPVSRIDGNAARTPKGFDRKR